MRRRSLVAVCLVIVLAAPLSGCFGAPPTPPPPSNSFVMQDGEGTNVTIKLDVSRIVSLTPSHTEVLFAIGVGSRVLGGTDFDNYPPEAASIQHVLVNLNVNFEAIITLKPDLVLVSSLNNRADIVQLRTLNLTVFYADALAVNDVPPMIELIGRAVGASANATMVANDLRTAINTTHAKAANATTTPRVFYLLDDYGAWWTAGGGTRGSDLITVSGGANIFSNVTGWASVSLENIVAAAPEVIILGLYVTLDPDTMNTTAPWSTMPAVQHGRIARVPDADIVDRPGPRLALGLDWMLEAIHPEL